MPTCANVSFGLKGDIQGCITLSASRYIALGEQAQGELQDGWSEEESR